MSEVMSSVASSDATSAIGEAKYQGLSIINPWIFAPDASADATGELQTRLKTHLHLKMSKFE